MNLFSIRKRCTYSSRLIEGAYQAGRKGNHGHRGDDLFDDWLDDWFAREQEKYPDLHSGFIRRLQAEYFRGVEAHEEALKARTKAPEVPAERPSRKLESGWFKGHRIQLDEQGECIVPTLDRESRFENVREAKRFITALG